MSSNITGLRFLGVGGAAAATLGNSAAVLEDEGRPVLLLDCGFTAIQAFQQRYQSLPIGLFLTHLHLDHCGGLETLFYRLRFAEGAPMTRLFVPAGLVYALHQRIAEYPGILAEGGGNFWDVFQLVPVGSGFWWQGLWYDCVPVRHHAPGTAFGVHLRGRFFYTGDTRPLPEVLAHLTGAGERIFHDCALHGNPSHTGLADLLREYPPALLARLVLYHYGSTVEAAQLRAAGMLVAEVDTLYAV